MDTQPNFCSWCFCYITAQSFSSPIPALVTALTLYAFNLLSFYIYSVCCNFKSVTLAALDQSYHTYTLNTPHITERHTHTGGSGESVWGWSLDLSGWSDVITQVCETWERLSEGVREQQTDCTETERLYYFVIYLYKCVIFYSVWLADVVPCFNLMMFSFARSSQL